MVNEGGNGRKKNRSRNKKKNNNKNQQGSPSTNQASSSNNNTPGATPDEQPTEFVPPPVAAAAVVVSAPEEKHRQRKKSAAEEEKCCGVGDDLAKHLIEDDDFVAKSYSLSSLQDAENSFYSSMEKGGKQEQQKKSDDELDLFASDDEVITEKPKMVKPAPKRKGGAKVNDGGKSCSSVKSSEMSPHEVDGLAALAGGSDVSGKIAKLESDNAKLHKAVNDLKNIVLTLQDKVAVLEKTCGTSCAAAPAKKAEEDDDVDLFGSDSDEEEDAEKVRIREERLKAYHEKKAKKPALIAKTSVLLDVKPWDDETDMDAMLACCKTIQKEGLVWGASKLVPIGYGIKKLQVMCVVEDEKVSIDELCEQIEGFEDYVQSVDVAAMSKI